MDIDLSDDDIECLTPSFSPEEFTRCLAKWVVRGNQPLSVVEDAGLRSVFILLKPDVPVPSAATIKQEIMECYHKEAARLSERLASVNSKISLTLDWWTSPNDTAFLGVTAYYINGQWTPHELVLDFLPLYDAHTSENLGEVLLDVCDRSGILPKLLGVTTDGTAGMNRLLSSFEAACIGRDVAFNKNEQHVRCVRHAFSFSAQALLSKLEEEALINGADSDDGADSDGDAAPQVNQLSCIAKLRSVIIEIRNSPQRRHQFYRECEVWCMAMNEPLLDTRTQWSSTYAMLERACELRQPLSNMARLIPDLPELSDEEWGLVTVTIHLPVLCGAADTTAAVRLFRLLSGSSAASQKPFRCYPPPATPR